MSRGSETVHGWVRNISDDGALILVDGTSRFLQNELGDKIDIEAFPDTGLPQLPKAGKLVRMFDVEGQQYLALRFLDYMDAEER